VDESFIGGKARNMHKAKRKKAMEYRHKGKVVVMGILERGDKATLQGNVKLHVEPGAKVMTDELLAYWGLEEEYEHKVINHAMEYVKGEIHTNSMENYWSLVKRSLSGTYISVEPFHLFRYLDEQTFRYNHRSTKDKPVSNSDRFALALSQIAGKRLQFKELTGKVEGSF
jgi:hypothetical protein